jgi:hypothetical protein
MGNAAGNALDVREAAIVLHGVKCNPVSELLADGFEGVFYI